MFCVKCGQQLPDNAKFCFQCGTPVGGNNVAPPSLPERWETCEIECAFVAHESNKVALVQFIADATGRVQP